MNNNVRRSLPGLLRRGLGRIGMVVLGMGALVGDGPSDRPAHGEETAVQKYVVSVERIWDRPAHSAFTDLIRFQGDLYCTFREGSGHIPGRNGLIRIIRSTDDGMSWQSIDLLDEAHVDLRDPKLCITSDGRLMLNTGASYYHGSERQKIESRVAFFDPDRDRFEHATKSGAPRKFAHGARLVVANYLASGLGLGVRPAGTARYGTLTPAGSKSRWDSFRARHDVGRDHPSETTLRFPDDGTMVAMIRRVGSTPQGWIGIARPPFTDWKLTPSNERFGGPNLIQLPDGRWLAGSRGYDTLATTDLWWLDLETAQFQLFSRFRAAGTRAIPDSSWMKPVTASWCRTTRLMKVNPRFTSPRSGWMGWKAGTEC
jgi:hypothetical protein